MLDARVTQAPLGNAQRLGITAPPWDLLLPFLHLSSVSSVSSPVDQMGLPSHRPCSRALLNNGFQILLKYFLIIKSKIWLRAIGNLTRLT